MANDPSKRKPAALLRQIQSMHLAKALDDYERGERGGFSESTKFDLVVGDRRYPPKAILGLAAHHAFGYFLTPEDFTGGESSACFDILRQAGYTIAAKNRGANPALTPLQGQQLTFWMDLRAFLKAQNVSLQMRASYAQNFQYFTLAEPGFLLEATVVLQGWKRISAGVTLQNDHAREILASLQEQRADLEERFGALLDWSSRNDKSPKECHVQVHLEGADFREISRHPEYFDWLRKNLEKLQEVFQEVLAGLCVQNPLFNRPSKNADKDDEPYLGPIVLACNDLNASEHEWSDEPGVTCHFPNGYKNLVTPGRRFIYYRGVRQSDGTRRPTPEYFGFGVVGSIYRDPADADGIPAINRRWFAEIDSYTPFPLPVSWETNGQTYEQIPDNLFGNGVRKLPEEAYESILQRAGVEMPAQPGSQVVPSRSVGIELGEQVLTESERPLFKTVSLTTPLGVEDDQSTNKTLVNGFRRSARSKAIGDRGEQLVYEWLQDEAVIHGWTNLRWVAKAGETPGWDMEFSQGSERIAVEVKATTLPVFNSIEITVNEWYAAKSMRENYWLALVASCESSQPKIQWIRGPYLEAECQRVRVEAILFRLCFVESRGQTNSTSG